MDALKPEQESQSSPTLLYSPVSQSPPQVTPGYPSPTQIKSGCPPPPQHPTALIQQYQQQHHQRQQGSAPTEWSTGICDCGEDPFNYCVTCFCPCITFGLIAETIDEGSPPCVVSGGIYGLVTYFTGCPFLFSCFYRTKMRHKFNLAKSPCGDILLHCCCESCALSQEYRELKHRGFDPTLGWTGNLEKQQQQQEAAGIPMAAPVGQTMSK